MSLDWNVKKVSDLERKRQENPKNAELPGLGESEHRHGQNPVNTPPARTSYAANEFPYRKLNRRCWIKSRKIAAIRKSSMRSLKKSGNGIRKNISAVSRSWRNIWRRFNNAHADGDINPRKKHTAQIYGLSKSQKWRDYYFCMTFASPHSVL